MTFNVESIRAFGTSSKGVSEATDAVFEGSILCDAINTGAGVRVWGDLDANIEVTDGLSGASTRIAVGKNLDGDITVGSGGVGAGNITIGWMPSVLNPQWNGAVRVNSVLLDPVPSYPQAVAGTGAVGLAPYGLHREACDPPYDPDYPVESPSSSQIVKLVHYGKVRLVPSSGMPYRVLEASGPHCDGTCIHGLLSDVTDGDPGPPARDPWTLEGVADRTVTIKGPTFSGKHYHIVLNSDDPLSPVQHLETDDLFGSQIDIPSYVYILGTN